MINSEKILWDNLRKGDKNAFNDIYYKYINVLFNYCKKFTGNDSIIEDCIQDLFTEIWLKRDKLGSTNRIKPYLLVSIKRRIIRQLTRANKNLNYEQISEFRLEYSFEETIINDEHYAGRINQLNKALENLTPRQKEIIYLKFYEQLSYEEIAEVMNVNTKAVYKLMGRAIKSLKTEFLFQLIFLSFFFNRN